MAILRIILVFQVFIFSSVSYSKLSECNRLDIIAQEVSFDRESGLIVFFDQTHGNEGSFQIWDLNSAQKITQGQLPDEHYKILGFVNHDTIAFAKIYDSYKDKPIFLPTYYNIQTNTLTEVFSKTEGFYVIAYSLAANLAVARNRRGTIRINLKTGEIKGIPASKSIGWTHYQSGFTWDGTNYYSATKANNGYDTKRLAISKWVGPNFFQTDPSVIAYVEPEDVGLVGSKDYLHKGDRSLSRSKNDFALSISIYKETAEGKKESRKLMWLDFLNGQKTFCDVDPEGISDIQIIDDINKKILLQNDASNYTYRAIVDMNTCTANELPEMVGLNKRWSGRLIKMPKRNLYYSAGGVWNLENGEPIFRSCR